MDNPKIVILLSACVNPNGMSYTKLQDSSERLKQYKSALSWYLENTSYEIVFVENTMTDFSEEYKAYIKSGRLEYITFKGNDYDRCLGKGYGEALILEKAIAESVLLKSADYILKITGRLILTNIRQTVKQAKSSDIVLADTSLSNGKCLAQSHVFLCPPKFLKSYFLPKSRLPNDEKGYYFEHLLYDCIISWVKDGLIHHDFKTPLKIDGVSASTGQPYYRGGILSSFKSMLKYILHRYSIYKNNIS